MAPTTNMELQSTQREVLFMLLKIELEVKKENAFMPLALKEAIAAQKAKMQEPDIAWVKQQLLEIS